MATGKPTFDVFLRTADTIYRAVPLQVVLGWAEQGRLAPTDGVRKGDTEEPWLEASKHPIITDYFPRPKTKKAESPVGMPASVVNEPIELDEVDHAWRKLHADDDDDVDMIP